METLRQSIQPMLLLTRDRFYLAHHDVLFIEPVHVVPSILHSVKS
jgi:hypothetical protein